MGLRRLVPRSEPRTIEELRLLQAVGRGVFRRGDDPDKAHQVGMFFFIGKLHDRYVFSNKKADLNLDEPDEVSLFEIFLGSSWGFLGSLLKPLKNPPKTKSLPSTSAFDPGKTHLRQRQREAIGLGDMGSSSRSLVDVVVLQCGV